LTYTLRKDGWPARAIHGDKGQDERDWVLSEFRSGKAPLMIATDVASRGLDVKDISTVINYDMSGSIEDYVHRIGRTGRAGHQGTAFTLFTPNDAKKARDLIKILREAEQPIPDDLLNFANHMGGGGFRGGRGGGYRGGGGYGGGGPRNGGGRYDDSGRFGSSGRSSNYSSRGSSRSPR